MNILDLEIFDQAANNLQQSLKQIDKFYPNDKSLANYLEAMAEVPPEEWNRFEPIKGEDEREALRNVSHFGGLMVSIAASLYSQYMELSGSIFELIEENDKQKKEIERLKVSEKFWRCAYQDSNEMSMNIDKMFLSKIN